MDNFLKNLLLFGTTLDVFTVIIRLVLAGIFGGIIGHERGKHGSQAGLRTHILVCLGASMTAMAGLFSTEILGYNGDPFRIAAQVISGIGFLGAGMIVVKNTNTITGLTTAAGMWTTAAIGIALGMGFYSGAFIAMVACVFTAAFLTRIERSRKTVSHLYIEINDLPSSGKIIDKIKALLDNDCILEVIPAKSGASDHLGVFVTTSDVKKCAQARIEIEKLDGVVFTISE